MKILYLLKSSISTSHFLTLVFALIFLAPLVMISHDAFAMGQGPGTCSNEYDDPITNATITVGNKTYYPLKNNVYLQFTNDKSYYLTFTIKTPSQDNQGNSDPGNIWLHTTVGGTISDGCVGPAYSNQNFVSNGTFSHPNSLPPQVNQTVEWATPVSSFSYTVNWVFPGIQSLVATSYNGTIKLSWSAPTNDENYPVTNYKIYRSTTLGTESLLTTLGNVNSYTDSSVTSGQSYYYYITYTTMFGESAASNEVNAILTSSTNGSGTDAVIATIPVGSIPGKIAANPNTDEIYVANGCCSHSISVIDGKTDAVVSSINLGATPAGISVNPNTNMIYADLFQNNTFYVINGSTNQVVTTVALQDGGLDVRVNPDTNKIYVAELYEINGNPSATQHVIQVIDGTTNTIVKTMTVDGSVGIAVNPSTNKIYANDNVIDGATDTVTGQISGLCADFLAVDPNTDRLYSTCGSSVQVVDLSTNTIIGSISASADGVDVNPVTNKIYVSGYGSGNGNTLSVIDGSTNGVIQTLTVGVGPYGVAVNPVTNKIYVSNSGSNSVSVIAASSSNTSTVSSASQNLQANGGNSQVILSWSAPSNNGGSSITNYKIYRSTSSGTETLLAQIGNVTSYTDITVTNGQTYFYKVTAVNSAGESAQSNEASATPTAPTTVPSAPTELTATTIPSSQINLRWAAPTNNGGSSITGYMIERSTDGSTTWSTIQPNTGSTGTTYSDTGLAASTTYTYRVSAINSFGSSSPSNTASTTTNAMVPSGITLNNIQSTSGTASNTITISNFNAGMGSNNLLLVGISANNNDVASVTFGGTPLKNIAYSFYNNAAEFWYLKNPSGTGDVIVTMNGPTQAVVGVYSFSGVNQTVPIPTHITKHNTSANSPKISITTKYANDWVLDLPSIYGGSTLGATTCTQQWDLNVPNAITGASSSTTVATPRAVSCGWTASSGDLWDDAAVEINAAR